MSAITPDLPEELAERPRALAEETPALRPSPKLQARMTGLLEKNRTSGLAPEERDEMQHYRYAEHLVHMAKGKALARCLSSN